MHRLLALLLFLPPAAFAANTGVSYGGAITTGNSYLLTVDPGTPGATIPTTFIGLSAETSAAVQSVALNSNTNLKAILSVLGSTGSFQFGNFTVDTTQPSVSRVQSAASFVAALGAGWQAMWGVSCTEVGPSPDAATAATNFSAIIPTAIYAIGSEPGFYGGGLCDPFGTYQSRWVGIHDAIIAAVPGAKFEAPDSAQTPNVPTETYVSNVAGDATMKTEVQFLTIHSITYGTVLSTFDATMNAAWQDPLMQSQTINKPLEANVVASGLKLRSTSIVGATTVAGTTDTMGSAIYDLWSCILKVYNGWVGADFLASDMWSDAAPYSPMIQQDDTTYLAKLPLYAMVMFQALQGGQVLPATSALPTTQPYDMPYLAVKGADTKTRILVLNKSLHDYRAVRLASTGAFTSAAILLLTSVACNSTTGVLGSATIQSNGTFTPVTYSVPKAGSTVTVNIPACSAILATLT